ncbi:phage NrS-1 polymerase family protein [Halobaculum lipolyticum]|uniref:NrS-1 polymerase-like HBD domain-containing protein n=1 Tax=Halobaculum lipolyticum TaxID=3032001 RepID=A0ABD5WIB9_9EURY|nr:hypothetical protein [Halobaculum sp. DT31]
MTECDLPKAADLPEAMTERSQWVCWRSQERKGNQTKVPIEPGTDAYASATDPETWRSFDVARGAAEAAGFGLGFVFTSDDPLVGVDLDDCRDLATGALGEEAQRIVSQLDSYTEVSPSGTGVHVIIEGDLPDGRNRHGSVEVYDDARFFTVTGTHLSETPTTVEHRLDELAAVHSEFVAAENTLTGSDSQPPAQVGHESDLTDSELLTLARAATNGEKFARLYSGSIAGYPSQSEADMALCSMLAFWTGGDASQMDRLFRRSGLFRGKWDEVHFSDGATYGERTIERAIAGTSEFYGGDISEAWAPFDHRSDPTEHDTTVSPAHESPRTITGRTEALDILREKLDELEEANEQLQAELMAERTRRKAAEDELAEQADSGIIERLFGW